jgi:ribosomal-protein-alanine N-acetyltransferase
MNLDVVFDTFPHLETERLALRELRSDDAESLFAVLGDEEVTEFYDDEVFRDVSEASEQIEAWAAGFRTRRGVRWGIAQRENGEIIGTCGYYGFHRRHKRAGIGYDGTSTVVLATEDHDRGARCNHRIWFQEDRVE